MRRQIVMGKGNCTSSSSVVPESAISDLINRQREHQNREMQRLIALHSIIPTAMPEQQYNAREHARQLDALRLMRRYK